MSRFQKHFTRDEANAILPWIQSIFAEVHAILKDIVEEVPGDILHPSETNLNGSTDGHQRPPGSKKSAEEPHHELHPDLSNVEEWLASGKGHHGHKKRPWSGLTHQEKLTLVNQLLQAFLSQGIVVQDIERGLIDFPAWRGGEEVLLCYELNDGPQIGFWHELDAGYAGRQPLGDWPAAEGPPS